MRRKVKLLSFVRKFRHHIPRKKLNKLIPYLYLLPVIIGMLVFRIGPVFVTWGFSLTDWDIVTWPPHWIGLQNYTDLVQDPLFWKVFGNTFYYAGGVVSLSLILSISIALLINRRLKGIIFFRTVYFMPYILPIVGISLAWGWLFEPTFGLINYLLGKLFHIPRINWLNSTTWAMPTLILLGTWQGIGYYTILFLAGLQNIPEQLYDAAHTDGANVWQRFIYITLPQLSPATFFVLLILMINSFKIFGPIYILTGGGPNYSTLTLSFSIYQNAFLWFRMGYAVTLASILFVIIFVFTFIQLKFQRRWVYYG